MVPIENQISGSRMLGVNMSAASRLGAGTCTGTVLCRPENTFSDLKQQRCVLIHTGFLNFLKHITCLLLQKIFAILQHLHCNFIIWVWTALQGHSLSILTLNIFVRAYPDIWGWFYAINVLPPNIRQWVFLWNTFIATCRKTKRRKWNCNYSSVSDEWVDILLMTCTEKA